MLTAKERVEIEVKELTEKITKLREFIYTPFFAKLSKEQRTLLREQQLVMVRYAQILHERLEIWEG